MSKKNGRRRVVIENVRPQVNEGRFNVKRAMGEQVRVRADIFADSHDVLAARLLWRPATSEEYTETPMRLLVNDLWEGMFPIENSCPHHYTVEAWVDHFRSWLEFLTKKFEAGQDIGVELVEGAGLLEAAAKRASGKDRKLLAAGAEALGQEAPEEAYAAAKEPELVLAMDRNADRSRATRHVRELTVEVDPAKAAFSTWYEMFPRAARSLRGDEGHGTFKDMEALLPEIARMGFDVLYLPPIHPIGRTSRKGKNNNPVSEAQEPGSPWAIGAKEGGHKAIHPELGDFDDFARLNEKAGALGIDIALDIAFQCSPDHPWVSGHPEWFKHRADGTIRYAENPPKKYQDIYPLDFESEDWESLWEALKDVFLFWCDKGVRVFRVDNPHTKSMRFWEWVLPEVKKVHPDAIFLSEAFTRPKIMYRLAKAGFTQSYTYFTWRNTKWELTQYMTELVEDAPRDYFRPNFWPNTPDILPEYLQYGGRPAFQARLVLAATLSSNYGIYGPAFELCENRGLEGKEEYADSEKFEIKERNWEQKGNLKDFIALVNAIRRDNPALQTTWNLKFLEADNEFIIFYAKYDDALDNIILTAVNLDPYNKQGAWLHLPRAMFGIGENQPFLVHDLLGDDKFIWHGERNFLELEPHTLPARIFRLRKQLKRETDFDYFM
jgi:starch synthase (maltosyl-transferring)